MAKNTCKEGNDHELTIEVYYGDRGYAKLSSKLEANQLCMRVPRSFQGW